MLVSTLGALDWRMRQDLKEAAYPHMIVVRFKGNCVMEPGPS